MTARFEIFDPLLTPAEAEAMLRLAERFGSYGSYAVEATNTVAFAPELPQRFDAAANFVRTGGRFARQEDPAVLAARTNYFRETYAYGDTRTPGIEPFLNHEGFIEAARKVHGKPVVTPGIVYANILVPGQELAVHTDVPEFRGANRKLFPQWLLVVMHHSGLFNEWHMPITTGIAYFNACQGGDLAYYPDGADGPPRTLQAKPNTAILLDTDSVFHGVDRVAESRPLPPLRPGMKLVYDAAGAGKQADEVWCVRDGENGGNAGKELARYTWDEVRFSVSWKAYCYADEAARRRAEAHEDDLELGFILDRLRDDLRKRGRLARNGEHGKHETLPDHELALLLIEEYVRFPAPQASA